MSSHRPKGAEAPLTDDLDVILPGFPGPSPDTLKKMYGNRIGGTHLQRD
jgi:hypothetical protein